MWRLILLGDIALQRNGVEVRRLSAQKYGHLLAYLALWPNRAHSRSELLEIFWPDEPLENAQMCLRTALTSLRRLLDCPDLLVPGPREIVRLAPGIISTDVQDFEQAIRDRDPVAFSLYNGSLLPGCYYEWALDEANRLEAIYEVFFRSFEALGGNDTADKGNTVQPASLIQNQGYRLPNPISSFYGREQELCELQRALSNQCRLLTLVGLGGIGKTRLAIELGRSLSCRVALAEFAMVHNATEIPEIIGAAIQLSRVPTQDLVLRLERELSEEPTVLILDNLEELVEAEQVDFIDQLLTRVPHLQIVATSRLPLGLRGEHIFSVSPLSMNAARSLFLDRARCSLPNFAESGSLTDLCDRLDCLPLAIELCATWAPLMSSARMLDALSNRFQWLEARKRHIPERHRSLSAVLRWTCPPDGMLMGPLRNLSVLAGRWNVEAAEALLGGKCIELLDLLQDRALIQVHVEDGEPTFSILQTVREFALEGISEVDLLAVRSNHCRYFCQMASMIAQNHKSEPQRVFRKLDSEQPNIFAAFEFGLGQTDDFVELVVRTFDETKWLWWVRGYEARVRRLVARIAELDLTKYQGPLAALILRAKANHAMNEERFEDALECCRHAIDIWEESGDVGRLADAHLIYGVFLGQAGRYDEAETILNLHLAEIHDDEQAFMIGLASLAGMLVDSKRNYEKAERYYIQMIDYWQSVPDGENHVAVLKTGLSHCLCHRGEYAVAEKDLRDAIVTMSKLGERIREAVAWEALAVVLESQQRGDDAIAARSKALFLRRATYLNLEASPVRA